jgi:ATP/maltotriose-dependent transcriptional regulator MalT
LIAALQTIDDTIGQGALTALQSPGTANVEAVLTTLINEIAAIPDRIVLVLDDYHLIEAQPIHDALAFLLQHLPPPSGGVHLVIATREDPPFPLARLRARGQLTELRATDLRFTPSEAAVFLNQAMGLDLSAEDVAALETRTEGWIAGLQLAAFSMQGSSDAKSFIKSFTGSHRYVLDYLTEEVLEQQSEGVQTFLLQTAVLDRLTGSLCDAVRFGKAKPSRFFGEASAIGWESGNIHMASFSARRLAEVQVMQGHLGQAAETYQQMQNLLARRGIQYTYATGSACVGMGELLCEWNDLDAAVQQLREGIEHGKSGPNARILLPGYVALARTLQSMGDAAGALGAIQEATQVWQQYHFTRWWGMPPVAAYQARLWLARGDVASATRWVQEQGLRADGELDYQREVEYITLARLLIAQGDADKASGLLQRLLKSAETGGRISRVIEILMLQALSLQAQRDTEQEPWGS